MSRKCLLVMGIAMLLCLLMGCSGQQSDPAETDYRDADDFAVRAGYIELPCGYGTLKYPDRWVQSLAVECRKSGNIEIHIFYYVDGDRKAEAARLSFGTEDGFLVGTVRGAAVSVRMGDIQDAQWSESDVLNYCAMQEDINELIAHLPELEGFSSQ